MKERTFLLFILLNSIGCQAPVNQKDDLKDLIRNNEYFAFVKGKALEVVKTGFNAGDGLKSTPCTYEFQGFRTASAILAAGLYWLALTTLHQRAIVCTEEREGRLYYQINLNSPNTSGLKGQHLRRPLDEVVKTQVIDYRGWLYDLATTSGTFAAGVGQGWIHNSPRRGLEFSTHKITHTAARIKLGMADELRLGNLESRRDWGYAADYVRAMWLMLQQDAPDDYVVATGETHSVQEFVEETFGYLDLDWRKYVVQDPKFYRPAEVDLLVGDASKAGRVLGWEPQVDFRMLVRVMVDADVRALQDPTLGYPSQAEELAGH